MAGKNLTLVSPSFAEGEPIPPRHTCDGENLSPALKWMHIPEGTKSFALIVDDPDAPNGTFTHWVLFDIPASRDSLAEGEKGVGVPGRNDFQEVGYGGPCPPPRHGKHRYFFTLYALDRESLGLAQGARRDEVQRALEGHVLDQTQLMGAYERR